MKIHLSWVLVNNELHHVRDFVHLRPNLRPTAFCPVCKSEVIMKLGSIREFHAAHKSDVVCPVTQSETALHLNAKLYIAEELRKQKTIKIDYPCDGELCLKHNSRRIIYIEDWDNVLVEYPIDQFRPDIVLKRNEETIGAVEVFVTHSIEPQKEEYLQNLSIPWVEVDASSVLENEWTSEQPLPYRKINPATVSTWYCATCSAAEKRAEIEKQYKKTAVRIVDFFYPNKKHFRSIFYARKRVQDSRITKIEIIENTEKVICSISEPTFPQDNQKLNHLFDQYIKKFKDRGYIVDDHMKWQPYDNEIFKQNIFARNTLKLLPRRYYWLQNKWVAVSAFQELNWNVRFTDKNQYEKQLSVLIQTLRCIRRSKAHSKTGVCRTP